MTCYRSSYEVLIIDKDFWMNEAENEKIKHKENEQSKFGII